MREARRGGTFNYREGQASASFLFGGEAQSAPRVSPDGRLVAIRTLFDGTMSVQLFKAEGVNLGRYPFDVRAVRWLPDNRLVLLFEDGREIRISELVPTDRELAGLSVPRRIILDADDDGRAFDMDVGPDGRTLAYTWVVNAGGESRRGEVRLLDFESGSVRRVASTPDFVAGDLVSGLLRIYNLWTVGWRYDGRVLFVGIGGSNRTVGPAGSGALLEVSTARSEVIALQTPDRDLRDGLQFPVSDGVRPLHHTGYGAAPGDPAPDLPEGLWPYTDYQWVMQR